MPSMTVWRTRKPEMERLYFVNGYSQADLADFYGISQPAIAHMMKRLGIKARTRPKKETPVPTRFVELQRPVFTRAGWWNPVVFVGRLQA